MTLVSPKLKKEVSGTRAWYPYYAGYTEAFATQVLEQLSLKKGSTVLDPWNGSGTTSVAGLKLGLDVIGFDLNPVMVIAAKGRSLSPGEYPSVDPLAIEIGLRSQPLQVPPDDPLLEWFLPETVASIRGVEYQIQRLLVQEPYRGPITQLSLAYLSDMTCFFYVCLFNILRHFLLPKFGATNPTWVRSPNVAADKLSISHEQITRSFQAQAELMIDAASAEVHLFGAKKILCADSTLLPIDAQSIDVVLTSPPYCTRIDYAVATRIELALLCFENRTSFRKLRRSLMGTTTVPKQQDQPQTFGPICSKLIENIKGHPSKASATYYLKTYYAYFSSLMLSIGQISRVLRTGGDCVLVLQGSYYKEHRVPLSDIAIEMAESFSLSLQSETIFPVRNTYATLNSRSRQHEPNKLVNETVLHLVKHG